MLRIVRVLAPNPGMFTLEGTNTWVVGRDPAVVIDPGPDDAGHLLAVLDEAGEVSAIVLTHHHPDHAPGAARLAEAAGAPVLAFRPAEGEVGLPDGTEIEAGGGRLVAVHAPGHTTDHVVLHAPEEGALFTGDAVLGRGTSVIDPPEGDLAAYLRSLRRMRELAPRTIYPGHGPAVFDGVGKIEEYLAHRAMREEQVLAGLRDGPATPAELVPRIYADQPAELHPVAARSVLAHLQKLEREDRVAHSGWGETARYALVSAHPCSRCGRPALPSSRLCRSCTLGVLQEPPPRPGTGPGDEPSGASGPGTG